MGNMQGTHGTIKLWRMPAVFLEPAFFSLVLFEAAMRDVDGD